LAIDLVFQDRGVVPGWGVRPSRGCAVLRNVGGRL